MTAIVAGFVAHRIRSQMQKARIPAKPTVNGPDFE
jgi:hypothetical protein